MIKFLEKEKVFILSNAKITYAMQITFGELRQLYFGAAVSEEVFTRPTAIDLYPFAITECNENSYSPSSALYEYPVYGSGDYRIPAILTDIKEDRSLCLEYDFYEITDKKPISNTPQLKSGGETLAIALTDKKYNFTVKLYYTIYEEGAIVKNCILINNGDEKAYLDKFSSACMDIDSKEKDLLNLAGRYGFERGVSLKPLRQGIFTVSSSSGISSHQSNPFVAILDKGSGEENGNVIGINLVYSGNFSIETEVDEFEKTRVVVGINPVIGRIILEPQDTFITPEVVFVFSDSGLGEMSRRFHDLYRNYLLNSNFSYSNRPIVLNSWEATYMNFDEDKLCDVITSGKDIGADMFVLDDGWFGHRNDDASSLGDWFVNTNKLKNGLKKIIQTANDCGMKFGLWFEPEMISKDSQLYKLHPDWAIKIVGRDDYISRHQMVLDFSKKIVVDYIFDSMSKILSEYNIDYVKLDMNRPLTSIKNARVYLGYIDGVYSLYKRLSEKYPNLFIEGCSGGGGRFDPAMLCYCPQIWCSDNTDAIARSYIQYGTTICYPLSCISNHISVCPNHQTNRTVSIKTRADIAFLGSFGYELNTLKLSQAEKQELSGITKMYKTISQLVLNGDLYRLYNPFSDGCFSVMLVSKDKSQAYVVYMQYQDNFNSQPKPLVLRGLDINKIYLVNNVVYTGATLMNKGIKIPTLYGDGATMSYEITEKK